MSSRHSPGPSKQTFKESEWIEVGYLTDTIDWVNNHDRLLRSLYWGDSDYKGHVLNTVAHILRKHRQNLSRLLGYAPLSQWLEANEPAAFKRLQILSSGVETPDFPAPSSSDSVREALADAQALLRSRGPTSALDRVHTAFHGYLKSVCLSADIPVAADASANALLKALIDKHPAVSQLGPRPEEVKRVLRTSGSILDAMATLRNQASLAHPNEELIDQAGAMLVINVARSLLQFMETKLNAPPSGAA